MGDKSKKPRSNIFYEKPRKKRLQMIYLHGGAKPSNDPLITTLQKAARSRAINRKEYGLKYKAKVEEELHRVPPGSRGSTGSAIFRRDLLKSEYEFAKARAKYFLDKLEKRLAKKIKKRLLK